MALAIKVPRDAVQIDTYEWGDRHPHAPGGPVPLNEIHVFTRTHQRAMSEINTVYFHLGTKFARVVNRPGAISAVIKGAARTTARRNERRALQGLVGVKRFPRSTAR